MGLLVTWIIIGIILCGLAYLVHNKKMYDFISGYNTSSEEEKEEYRNNGYLTYSGRFLWGMAIIWLFGTLILALAVPYALEIQVGVFLVYTLGGTIYGSRYSLPKKRKRNYIISISLTAIVLAFVSVLFFMGLRPTNVTIDDKTIFFSGMYSYELNREDILSAELIDSLPNDMKRTNGFGSSTRALGHFSSEELGKGRMYVFLDDPPYILLDTKKGFLILNSKDEQETMQWYNIINGNMKE